MQIWVCTLSVLSLYSVCANFTDKVQTKIWTQSVQEMYRENTDPHLYSESTDICATSVLVQMVVNSAYKYRN